MSDYTIKIEPEKERVLSELLRELEAKASPRPWTVRRVQSVYHDQPRYWSVDAADDEIIVKPLDSPFNPQLTALAANHLRPLVEAVVAERRVDEAVDDCHNCYQWTSSGGREGRCEQHILAGHHARELRTKALAALHTDLEAALKAVGNG